MERMLNGFVLAVGVSMYECKYRRGVTLFEREVLILRS